MGYYNWKKLIKFKSPYPTSNKCEFFLRWLFGILLVDAETAEKIINKNIIPESVIFLNANDNFLNNRVKCLPEENLLDTHWDYIGINRRLPLMYNLF